MLLVSKCQLSACCLELVVLTLGRDKAPLRGPRPLKPPALPEDAYLLRRNFYRFFAWCLSHHFRLRRFERQSSDPTFLFFTSPGDSQPLLSRHATSGGDR